jgi:hypothetical protein
MNPGDIPLLGWIGITIGAAFVAMVFRSIPVAANFPRISITVMTYYLSWAVALISAAITLIRFIKWAWG